MTLHSLRSRFAKTPESSYRQLGLRRIRDALRLEDRNPAEVERLTAEASYYLQYAEAGAR